MRASGVAIALAAAVAVGSGGTAIALGSGGDHSRGEARVLVSGQSSAGSCKMGYDTQTSTLVPPDDTTGDNTPAASVQLKKKCAGAVIATFTSEIQLPAAGDFIHLDLRAKCNGPGGLTGPTCTPGQTVFAAPGHVFLDNDVSTGTSSHSVNGVFRGLKRGSWTFQALPGGNNSGNLQFRSLVVEGFTGG